MDQLSEIVYKNRLLYDEVEGVINESKCLSLDQKKRWKGMLFFLTKNQLKELKELILRENSYVEHPEDFVEKEADNSYSEIF